MERRLAGLLVGLLAAVAGCAPAAAPAAGSVDAGKRVFQAGASLCVTCHTLSGVPEATGTIGPKLDGIGTTAGTRKPGVSAEAYIRESITNPNAFIVPGFDTPSAMIPGPVTGKDLDDLVAFLLAQK